MEWQSFKNFDFFKIRNLEKNILSNLKFHEQRRALQRVDLYLFRDGVINPKDQVISPTHVSQELACLAHSEERGRFVFNQATNSNYKEKLCIKVWYNYLSRPS